MSQEILFTSAPQGLRPGSRGFCPVVATAGMPQNLADRLGMLSGYRHAFAVNDPKCQLNPVNYSHRRITIGRQQYHVLSRICDAGLDFSRRENKLAHHVALEASELVPGGPAWVLADTDFSLVNWDGQTRQVPSNRCRPRQDCPPHGVCRSWHESAGDAGWAGVLAGSALQPGGRAAFLVVFPPGTDTLMLVVEPMRLLPAQVRWDVTFSTYFTGPTAGVDCQWRFVLDGTDEARKARRNPRMPVIDLCLPQGPAPDGPLVHAARTGTAPI